MRYVAKIHVLDVLDQVVVSGYVYDADGPVTEGEAPTEFTLSTPGLGLDHPMDWLFMALYRAFMTQTTPPAGRGSEGPRMGGPHIISETGDIAQNRVR